MIALTRIEHDGKVFEVGSDISSKDVGADAFALLEDAGAVGFPPAKAEEVADQNEALRAQVEALKAQLATAQKPAPPK